MQEKFVYHVIEVKFKLGLMQGKLSDNLSNTLNSMGQQGWELVSIVPKAETYGATASKICVFKRKI